MTRRPPKPAKELSPPPVELDDRKARALDAILVPPSPLEQLAEWRAKMTARHVPGSAKSPLKKKR